MKNRNIRARDLGIKFEGKPARLNAITDVAGVAVGHTTIISGTGAKAVRTGVTAILPRGQKGLREPVFAGWFSLNGNGEMTGTTWVEESGCLFGPIMITNTNSVGIVRDSVVEWQIRHDFDLDYTLPVVAETWDGYLNDIDGLHIKKRHAFAAIDSARPGPVEEGNVGGGTGMVCYEFKGGIGTASRQVNLTSGSQYSVGVLVQANHGVRQQLHICGVPVGLKILDKRLYRKKEGSIIIVIATNAPLLPHQLKRIARRASMGLARTGSISGNGSGDIFVAFSTANRRGCAEGEIAEVRMLPNAHLDALFEATVQATEESITNALVAAETMSGFEGHTVIRIPHDRLRNVMRKYNKC
jgi:L-aminopeptidase/D-esterase-like protein